MNSGNQMHLRGRPQKSSSRSAPLVFGTNMEDVLTVLELANVQLRELHDLDDRLDDSLQESYDIRARAKSVKTSMQRIRELMLDGRAFSEAAEGGTGADGNLGRKRAILSDGPLVATRITAGHSTVTKIGLE